MPHGKSNPFSFFYMFVCLSASLFILLCVCVRACVRACVGGGEERAMYVFVHFLQLHLLCCVTSYCLRWVGNVFASTLNVYRSPSFTG